MEYHLYDGDDVNEVFLSLQNLQKNSLFDNDSVNINELLLKNNQCSVLVQFSE